MQNPEKVISVLVKKSKSDDNFRFKRLYRNLYNKDFFYQAYAEMSPKEGNMTAGTDNETIDGMSIAKIDKLIHKLKDYSYKPKPVRRIYIPKKDNPAKERPLGIPSIEDKMVQYTVKYILEALYECKFSDSSHGFRPKRSCHTALKEVKKEFKGMKWFIEGDIRGFFDNIDHHILINILRRKIADEYFIGLIWKFLKAGYLEDWKYYPTYSGTPQGGIISPILANIYLNELDNYIQDIQSQFNTGQKKDRKRNQEYRRIELQLTRFNRKIKPLWADMTKDEKREALTKIKDMRNAKLKLPYYVPFDTAYRRLKYVRYADDFIIGINGSRQDAAELKARIKDFLNTSLKLELSEEKTLITHSGNMARFLGYDIVVRRDNSIAKDKEGKPKRVYDYSVGLYLPYEVWKKKLLRMKVLKICKGVQNEEVWKPHHRPELAHTDDLEILSKYNAEIRGYHNYYRFADNSTVLQKFRYVMEYSMYKTFANKYKSSIGKIKNKYCINGEFAVKYQTKTGEKTSFLYHESFAKQDILKAKSLDVEDTIPNTFFVFIGSRLMNRLKARECEMCGKTDVELEMHHIKKLKDLKGKSDWERLMISKHRKTLALCLDCHNRITLQQRLSDKKAKK